jgi:hypothetical protein
MKITADIFEYTSKKCLNSILFQFLVTTCKRPEQPIDIETCTHSRWFGKYIRTGLATGMKIDEFARFVLSRMNHLWKLQNASR